MTTFKKLTGFALAAVMVFSAAAVAPAAVPTAYAKTKSAVKLKKPTKFKAKLKNTELQKYGIYAPDIKLTWKKVKRAKKYEVYRAKISAKGKAKYKKLATVKKTRYTDESTYSGAQYKYKVRAVNGKVKGKFSAASKKLGYLNVPVFTVEMNEECTGIRLQWNESDGAKGYKLYRSDNKGKSYKLLKDSKSFKKAKDGTYTYTDSAVKLSNHYYYYIVAYNSKMTSAKSAVKRVIFKDYSYAVQVGKTKSENVFGIGLKGLEDYLTVQSDDESILKVKKLTDSEGVTKVSFTGVKAGYTYITIKIGEKGTDIINKRYKVKVSEEPVYDLTIKKGESAQFYNLDQLKMIQAVYKKLGAKLNVSAVSSNTGVVSISNPGSLDFSMKGISEGEATVKIKISVSIEGEKMSIMSAEITVKVE